MRHTPVSEIKNPSLVIVSHQHISEYRDDECSFVRQ